MAGIGPLYDWHVAQGADAALLSDAPIPDAKLRVLREHLDLVTVSPALGTHEDQHVLAVSGITPDEIVLVSQLVAYVSNLVRVIAGFAAVAGREVPSVEAPARALASTGRTKNQDPHTITGHEKPTAFTQRQLAWEPWVAAPAEDELTPEQIDSFASKSTTNSVYFRLISRTPAVTKARSALDNAVFLSKEGLPKAERELAAAVASKVNDCIYCASVHARKATFHSKREADVDRLLAQTLPRDENWIATDVTPLSAGQDERWSAIIDAAAKLSELRPTLAPADIDRLRAVGLDDVDIADLIGSTAFFAWANRLWQEAVDQLEGFGIPVVVATAWDHLVFEDTVTLLGEVFDAEEGAQSVLDFHDEIAADLDERLEGVEPKTVYLETVDPYLTALPGSGFHAMIEQAGGENVFADAAGGDAQEELTVDPAEVVLRDPDFIFHEFEPSSAPNDRFAAISDELTARPGWSGLAAVQDGQIAVANGWATSAAAKIIGAAYLATWLHPEATEGLDPDAYLERWVTEFQDTEFTSAEDYIRGPGA